jgi:hypothetical protein
MAGAGFQIPIELKINFLEYVVKPSFGVTHTPEKPRDLWMREFAGLLYGDHLDILMIAFNTIETLQEAKEELEKARADRAVEREFMLQQQRAGTLYFNLMFFLFLYVFFPT